MYTCIDVYVYICVCVYICIYVYISHTHVLQTSPWFRYGMVETGPLREDRVLCSVATFVKLFQRERCDLNTGT